MVNEFEEIPGRFTSRLSTRVASATFIARLWREVGPRRGIPRPLLNPMTVCAISEGESSCIGGARLMAEVRKSFCDGGWILDSNRLVASKMGYRAVYICPVLL